MRIMKKIIGILAMTMCCLEAYPQMPGVSVENGKGEKISTAALVDNKTPMIVSFWSTVCKPCIMELNAINDAMDEWLEEVDFRVVAVSIDDMRSATKARSFVSGNGWNSFTVLFDKNQDFMRAMNVSLTPHTFIFDKSGKIVYSHTGYTPGSENELLEKIKKLK